MLGLSLTNFSSALRGRVAGPKSFYSTTFAGVVNASTLRSLAGWGAYSSTGATSAERDYWKINTEQAQMTSSEYAASPGVFLIGYSAGSTDFIYRCTLTQVPSVGSDLVLACAGTDNQNCIFTRIPNSSGTMLGFNISKTVAGTVTQLFGCTDVGSIQIKRNLLAGDVIELVVLGRLIHMFVNGLRVGPAAGASIDAGGVFTKGMLCGVGTANAFNTQIDDIYIAPIAASIAITDPPAFVPGTLAAGGVSTSIAGTYVGAISGLQYRVVNSASRAEVQTWLPLSSAAIGGGAWSGVIFSPLGSIATNPKFRVEVRATNDNDTRASSSIFAVGLAVGNYGQSNAGFRSRSTGAAVATSGNTYLYWGGVNNFWDTEAPTSTNPAYQMVEQLSTLLGVPTGLMSYGVGSQTIVSLSSSGVGYYDDLQGHLDTSRARNRVAAWVWTQGEAEAEAMAAFDSAAYRANFVTLAAQLRADSGGSSPILVAMIGQTSGVHAAGAVVGDKNWTDARICQNNLKSLSGVYPAHGWADLVLADTLHYSETAYLAANKRAGRSVSKALGYTATDGRGPLFTGATRSGAVVTLAVALNGADSISGTGLTNYEVSTDDFATVKTISSAAVSVGSVVLTLAADPGAICKVRSFYGRYYGAAPVHALGAYADGTTICVEPLYAPISTTT